MYPLNQIKTLVSCGRDPARSLPLRRGFLLIPLMLVCFALSPQTQAVPQPNTPDPGAKPVSNTADGQNSLASITTGIHNSAFGFDALISNSDANFNTAVGSAALLLNNASENTGIGVGALLLNTTAANNTAVGAFALFDNSIGEDNTAVGDRAMLFNVDGSDNNAFGSQALGSLVGFLSDTSPGSFNNAFGRAALFSNTNGFGNNAFGDEALFFDVLGALNTAVGDIALLNNLGDKSGAGSLNTAVGGEALVSNTTGSSNNAVGADALADNTEGSFNTAMGDLVGFGNSTGSGNIYIGAFSEPVADGESFTIRIGDTASPDLSPLACFVGGIAGVPVSGDLVAVDLATGQLGSAVAAGGAKVSVNDLVQQQHLVQELKAATERQAATIALQEGQIKALTAGLKQQADQIQKVSAQLEMIRPTPRVVENR